MDGRFDAFDRLIGRMTPGWTIALAVMLGAAAFGVLRYDLVTGVTYRRVPVISVAQVPGYDMAERLVVVDLGDRRRAIRTGDPLLWVEAGGEACVAERYYLLRRWRRHALELPGYCRGAPALVPAEGAP